MRASLAAFRELGSLMGMMLMLYSFADIARRRGQHERALRLVGASDALRARGGDMPVLATTTMGDVGEAARSFLDEGRARRVYEEGLAMEPEEALAYVLRTDSAADGPAPVR